MANISINVENNTFSGESSVIRNLYEAPKGIDFEQIEEELREIKATLKEGSPAFEAVETLEKNSKKHDWSAICSSIGKFSSQFTSATLASLAGRALSQLLGLGQ